MRTTFNRLKAASKFTRSAGGVVNYNRPDLTKRWVQRIQSKVRDSSGLESYTKLSSLVDFYNKPAQKFKDDIDWAMWKNEIRTSGVVDKLQEKYESFKKQDYNIDLVAQRSTANSEKYETYVCIKF